MGVEEGKRIKTVLLDLATAVGRWDIMQHLVLRRKKTLYANIRPAREQQDM